MSDSGKYREHVKPGMEADIILKKDQRSGARTRGIIKDLLTNSSFHPHGIKVRLTDGQVGRVAEIIKK
ncbi:YwbE family protein [Bacillus infantis]|uniref:YwbE family protein n=1 Tax=Bacillus infantis TaxID=324767 RepID=A0A5D4R0P7_9BACI|nr:YwbE family protein [Bacillus infantis]TYS44100.1 YwbE family protein [Bacillus infantis]